jgi:hypothetical protein
VAVAIFFIARHVTPDRTTGLFGQHLTEAVRLKSQLATAILALAIVQLVLALWMYRRLPGFTAAPAAVPRVHRVIGALTFLGTIPIAVHCIQAYGLELTPVRAAVHSLSACFFYGAFAAKVLSVRSRRGPGWMLPVVGGCLVVAVVAIWYTSALWYFDGYRVPGF